MGKALADMLPYTLGLIVSPFPVVAVIAQLVIVVPLGRAVSVQWVAVAHAAIAVGMILLVAAGVFGRGAPRAIALAVWASLPAVLLAIVFPLLALVAPDGWFAAIVFSAIGLVVYVGLGALLWPSVARPVLHGVLRR